MALLIKQLISGYRYAVNDLPDPRVVDYPLAGNPIPVLAIIFAYLSFVFNVGPKFMAERKPFNINQLLIAYNALQVLICGYVVYGLIANSSTLDVFCTPLTTTTRPNDLNLIHFGYVYYMTKIVDLLDTVFFIMRKKFNQASYLHIYHHAFMVFFCYIGVKYIPSGHTVYLPLLNSIVHVIMYFYYMLTAVRPEYKNNLWWKKYITQLQLIQFIALFIIYTLPLFNAQCSFPKLLLVAFLPQTFIMMILFGDYYYREYIKKRN